MARARNFTGDLEPLVTQLDKIMSWAKDLETKFNNLVTLVNEIKSDFNNHAHRADGSQVGAYTTSRPVSDISTVTGGTPQTVAAADGVNVAASAFDASFTLEGSNPVR